jgi:hypothetical protein
MSAPMPYYPGFAYPSYVLVRFLFTGAFCTLLLEDDSIVHFEPSDPEDFKLWLIRNKIADVMTCLSAT